MSEWLGKVEGTTVGMTILSGPTFLASGLDAARIQVALPGNESRPLDALAFATPGGHCAVLIDLPASRVRIDPSKLGQEALRLTVQVTSGQVRTPTRTAQRIFGLDPTDLSSDEARWLRHATLFVMEAEDIGLRAERIEALKATIAWSGRGGG